MYVTEIICQTGIYTKGKTVVPLPPLDQGYKWLLVYKILTYLVMHNYANWICIICDT